MWWRVILAVLFAGLQVWGISAAFTQYELNDTDTSFLPRSLLLSTTMLFMMMLMWPDTGMFVSRYYIFCYVMMYTWIVLMYITREPLLGIFAVFSALLAVGLSVRTSAGLNESWAPLVWGVYVFVLVWVFYSDDKYVDDLVNLGTKRDNILPSKLPVGYLSGESSILAFPVVTAAIMGLFTFGYLRSAYWLRKPA